MNNSDMLNSELIRGCRHLCFTGSFRVHGEQGSDRENRYRHQEPEKPPCASWLILI
jgi:hypothetical protein